MEIIDELNLILTWLNNYKKAPAEYCFTVYWDVEPPQLEITLDTYNSFGWIGYCEGVSCSHEDAV